jgi:threonine dehydrogenase-like Zn-dependent dehydrogenase
MRAIQIVAPGRPEFVEIPAPEAKPGFGLVRPLLIALCGSDVRSVYYAPAEEYPLAATRGGHEIIARIEALGKPEPGLQAGQIVLALSPGDMGMAEYFATPVENLLPLPEGKPLEHLLMAQQLGTVIYGCKRLPNIIGMDAVVIGQGSVGLFFDAMLRRLGADRVIAMDVVDARVEAGRRFGATHAFNNSRTDALSAVKAITNGRLADLVVEAAGEPETINMMASLVRERGFILSFGLLHGPHTIPFDYYNLYRKTCALLSMGGGTANEPGRKSVRQALDLIARGEIDVSGMVTHRFPFDRVKDAYEMARTRADGAIKVIVEMP